MSASGVPYGGIALTASITLLGVGLNAVVPEQAFEIVLNVAALGILSSWAMIVLCQLKLVTWSNAGIVRRPSFRLPFSPWSGYAVLVFLLLVLVLMALDYPTGTYTIASLVIIVPALVGGLVRRAEERGGGRGRADGIHGRVPGEGEPAGRRLSPRGSP